jgi:hypothetical protein
MILCTFKGWTLTFKAIAFNRVEDQTVLLMSLLIC